MSAMTFSKMSLSFPPTLLALPWCPLHFYTVCILLTFPLPSQNLAPPFHDLSSGFSTEHTLTLLTDYRQKEHTVPKILLLTSLGSNISHLLTWNVCPLLEPYTLPHTAASTQQLLAIIGSQSLLLTQICFCSYVVYITYQCVFNRIPFISI